MAIIGNQILSTNYLSDQFSGDGSTVAFTLSLAPASAASISVYVSGLYQIPGSAYTVSGSTLTFTGAPPTGTNNIYVLYLGVKNQNLVPVNGSITPQMLNNANVVYWGTGNNNVGIGNTTPTDKLSVNGKLSLQDQGDGLALRILGSNDSTGYSGFGLYNTAGTSYAYQVYNDFAQSKVVHYTSSNPIDFMAGGSTRVRMAANGFVGVGTTVPRSQFEVYKATTGGEVRITSNSDAAYGEIIFSSNNATYADYGASIAGFGASGIDSGILAFKTGYGTTRTERVRIDQNGNVGVGTSTPGSIVGGKVLNIYNLSHATVSIQSVDGGNDRNSTLELLSSGNGGSYSQILYGDTDTSPGTPSPLVFAGYHSGTRTERVRFNANGHVYFGYNANTTATVGKTFATAHASGNRGARLNFGIDDGSFGGMCVYNTTSSNPSYNSQYISFETHQGAVSAGERMRITSDGYVGIGTGTPAGKLHVLSGSSNIIIAHNNNIQGSASRQKYQTLMAGTTFGAGESGTWKKVAYVSHSPMLDIIGCAEQNGNPALGGGKLFGTIRGTYGSVGTTEITKHVQAMNGGTITGFAYQYNNSGYDLEVQLTYSGSGPFYVSTVIRGIAQDDVFVRSPSY